MSVRTRFAPSPTGYLHIGGARTALYAWLFAKKNHGKFILRIEDTDVERSTPEAVQAILDSMHWLRLDYDEGPFYQMKRLYRYREVADQLLREGHAYRCYCSKERLEKIRFQQVANHEKPRYDNHCRDLKNPPKDAPFVIRFKNPLEGQVLIDDQVKGPVVVMNSELDDLIIMRSDGTPTYNFTVVVDDMDMAITHVIRGDDHLNNTPRQINMFKALGVKLPVFAHISMILGEDGKKLSKRHGAVSVMQYRDDGYLPQTLLNYLVRLGWAHGDQEIFSKDEMITLFDLKNIHKAASAFNPSKLLWLNQHYIKTLDPADIEAELLHQFQQLNIDVSQGPELREIILLQRERAKTLKEMAQNSVYFYQNILLSQALKDKHFTPESIQLLKQFADRLMTLSEWTDENIHQAIVDTCTAANIKMGQLAQSVRVAITGGTVSPPLNATLRVLGKQKTLERLSYTHRT